MQTSIISRSTCLDLLIASATIRETCWHFIGEARSYISEYGPLYAPGRSWPGLVLAINEHYRLEAQYKALRDEYDRRLEVQYRSIRYYHNQEQEWMPKTLALETSMKENLKYLNEQFDLVMSDLSEIANGPSPVEKAHKIEDTVVQSDHEQPETVVPRIKARKLECPVATTCGSSAQGPLYID